MIPPRIQRPRALQDLRDLHTRLLNWPLNAAAPEAFGSLHGPRRRDCARRQPCDAAFNVDCGSQSSGERRVKINIEFDRFRQVRAVTGLGGYAR